MSKMLLHRKNELLSLVPLQQRSANGEQQFTGQGVPDKPLKFDLDVTALTGTSPTLDVVIEQSVAVDAQGQRIWTNKASFAQKTAAGSQTLTINNPWPDYCRVRWTIGGTGSPSATFSVRCDLDKAAY